MIAHLYRLLYAMLWIPALPVVLLRLCWRARRQPGYLMQLGERFAHYPTRPSQPTIWIHAVSVGETRAAEPLIRALLTRWPDHSIVLTHMTPTGKETSSALFGKNARITRVYLPYDMAFLSERFLRHFQPDFGIIMETELWPALLHRCERHNIPVILANGRLSRRSARRYARLPQLSKAMLSSLTIASQTPNDADHFSALGARDVTVTGNIKFDIAPPHDMMALAREFRSRFGQRLVLLAASTRDGEEELLLDAFAAQAPADVLLILVPRHPQRFDTVANVVRSRGLRMQRRSENAPVDSNTQVWLGDSMGEMFAYYACADAALIGGSWLPLGGQNLIESCAVGTPVVLGPHTFNFALTSQQAIDSGAAVRATDAADGMRKALALLHDNSRRQEMSSAGKQFAATHRGATGKTIELIVQRCSTRKNSALTLIMTEDIPSDYL